MHKKLYMHTINGRPAVYWPGEQICYINRYQHDAPPLAKSLKQIRKEQRASNKWRKSMGFGVNDADYGYVMVGVP